jgi:hypothetical protein
VTRAFLGAFVFLGLGYGAFGQELLFSFAPEPNNFAMSTRPFSTEELLIVTVMGMRPGDRLLLNRCGNARCSVGMPVNEWTFENFERRVPTEIYTDGNRYSVLAFSDGNGMVGVSASIEDGVTILRFVSGMSVTIEVRRSR